MFIFCPFSILQIFPKRPRHQAHPSPLDLRGHLSLHLVVRGVRLRRWRRRRYEHARRRWKRHPRRLRRARPQPPVQPLQQPVAPIHAPGRRRGKRQSDPLKLQFRRRQRRLLQVLQRANDQLGESVFLGGVRNRGKNGENLEFKCEDILFFSPALFSSTTTYTGRGFYVLKW